MSTTGAIRLTGQAAGDRFGTAVAAYGDDLWIGAPGRAVSGATLAGVVYHYRFDGSTAHLVQTISENSPHIPGYAEHGDLFGSVLAADDAGAVAVGEPAEDVGGRVDAGTVTVIRTDATRTVPGTGVVTGARAIAQVSPGISGGSETGDQFGASLSMEERGFPDTSLPDDVAIGVPGEDAGSVADAGLVHVVTFDANTYDQTTAINQENAGVPGVSEAGDQFGATVQLGSLTGGLGELDLAVGAPGEDLGTVRDAGDVLVFGSQDVGHFGYRPPALRQGGGSSGDVGGVAGSGDRLGAGMGTRVFSSAGPSEPGHRAARRCRGQRGGRGLRRPRA